jgi:hypothetical protein
MRSANCFLQLPGRARFAEARLGILALHLRQQLTHQLIGEQIRRLRVLALPGHGCGGHRTLFPLSSHDLDTLKI